MQPVGEFPGREQVIRAPLNPLDKSTIVSIYPMTIVEEKYTVFPGIFTIPSGSYDSPSILVVGTSSYWRKFDIDQPPVEVPVSSVLMASSIVNNYCIGLMACDMEHAKPGIFFLPGEHTLAEIKAKYKSRLDEALAKQRNWYSELVKLADALWARSNASPMAISNDMRIAAKELGLETKDWMQNQQAFEMTRCFACGSLRNPQYPVCGTCKAVDMTHPRAKELKFAV